MAGVESFEIFAIPELRAVLRTVFDQLENYAEDYRPAREEDDEDDEDDKDDERPPSLELLKPFKMAHASPRVFWNLARAFDGDVAAGLRSLLPDRDWSFLEEREKRRSGKAIATAAQAAQATAEAAARKAKREAAAAVKKAKAESAQMAAAVEAGATPSSSSSSSSMGPRRLRSSSSMGRRRRRTMTRRRGRRRRIR